MDADLIARLEYELRMLEGEQAEYLKQLESLKDCDGIRLKRLCPAKGGEYIYSKERGSDQYRYLGGRDHLGVKRIREMRHCKEALERIEDDMRLVKALLDGYRPYDYRSVDAGLPAAYRTKNHLGDAYHVAGTEWLEDRLRRQAEFPENYPEAKTEQASDGIWLKTLSELLVYERMRGAGLFVIYELPLVSCDYGPNLYPDFTVLSPLDMRSEIIVEYVGRLDMREYRDAFARRVHRYLLNGYIPGVNLFFIFGDLKGHVDSLQITKVIADIKGLR